MNLDSILKTADRYYQRLVVSGTLVQLYDYERPIKRGTKSIARGGTESYSKPLPREHTDVGKRTDNLARSRKSAKRLVHANMRTGAPRADECDLWLTFTYAHAEDALPHMRQNVLNDVARFVERFSAKYRHRGYMYVLELQDGAHYKRMGIDKPGRNVLHAHMLIFGAPKVHNDFIKAMWGKGGTWTSWIQGDATLVHQKANYIGKYVGKAPIASLNEKGFVTSENLVQPLVTTNPFKIARYLREHHLRSWHRYESSPMQLLNRAGIVWNTMTYVEYRMAELPAPMWYAKGDQKVAVAVPLHDVSEDT